MQILSKQIPPAEAGLVKGDNSNEKKEAPVIALKDVAFTYKSKIKALEDISIKFEKGDFIGIIGPNGSGKSTLLKIIEGLLKPLRGTVLIHSKPLDQLNKKDLGKEISYVPQENHHTFPTTVFDAALLGRIPHIDWNIPKAHDIKVTAEILEKLGLGELALRNLDELSGGQRQKVFIARALVQEPETILLDEPTSNLDIKHQLEIMEILQRESSRGRIIITAIHDINLALKYCNKFILLKNGKIIAAGGKDIITSEIIEEIFDVKVKKFNHENETYFFFERIRNKMDNNKIKR